MIEVLIRGDLETYASLKDGIQGGLAQAMKKLTVSKEIGIIARQRHDAPIIAENGGKGKK